MVTRTELDPVFAFGRARLGRFAVVALAVHVALGVVIARRHAATRVVPKLEDVDIALSAPPPQEPPPPQSANTSSPGAPTSTATARVHGASSRAALGHAGPVLVAKTSGKTDEPTSFVSDPDGQSFASGTAGVGGTAEHGDAHGNPGVVSVVRTSTKTTATIARTANLSRGPKLPGNDPCRGFFPPDAVDDVATVSAKVTVREDGSVASVDDVSESVSGEGFARAARSCLRSTRFVPALDAAGRKTGAFATIRVHFSR